MTKNACRYKSNLTYIDATNYDGASVKAELLFFSTVFPKTTIQTARSAESGHDCIMNSEYLQFINEL